MHEHKYLENIKKWYKYSGKCDYQFKYKAILEAYFLSTPEVFTENIPMYLDALGTMKNPSEIKPPSQLLALFDVTQKTAVHNGSC